MTMLRTLEEIREAGARAVANFPPLTEQQLDMCAALIHPTIAAPGAPGVRTHAPKAAPLPLAA